MRNATTTTWRRAICVVLLMTAAACASHRQVPLQSVGALEPIAGAVAIDRSRLDSVIAHIHALSGDSSRSSLSRLTQLRSQAATLDSRYRADLADLLTAVNASTAGITGGAATFPIDKSSDPFVRA